MLVAIKIRSHKGWNSSHLREKESTICGKILIAILVAEVCTFKDYKAFAPLEGMCMTVIS